MCTPRREMGAWVGACFGMALVLAATTGVAEEIDPVFAIGVGPPGHHAVESVTLLRRDAGRLDWSVQGDVIAFDARDADGFYDVFLMSAEGERVRCVTCEHPDLRKADAFNPTWHPSGQWIVLQVRRAARRVELSLEEMATPHRAFRSDLWAIRVDGKDLRPLTHEGQNGGIVLDPFFSFEADRLAWSERLSSEGGKWGRWGVRTAAISLGRTGFHLGDTELYEPVAGLVLAQGYSNDEGQIFVVTLGHDARAPRLGSLDVATGRLQPLPHAAWGSAPARLSPREGWLVWASSRDTSIGNGLQARSDLWRARLEGGEAERLTYFNREAADDFVGETLVGDFAFDPSGERFAAHLVVRERGLVGERIVMVRLAEGM